MKTSVLCRGAIVSVLLLKGLSPGPGALCFAQTRPILVMRFSAGQPTLNITGTLGSVYSIQYANDLSPTSHWSDRTLLQLQTGGSAWTDPLSPAAAQRFYRAVPVAAPADTNLVFIQPGTFTMGSPTNEALRGTGETDETQHIVTLSRGFWVGKYLVTQRDYLSVVGSNPSWFNGVAPNGIDYSTDLTRPVESVSWSDATNYCCVRTQQEQAGGLIPTNYVYRLPTESEWEYACRAGTTTAFYLGNGLYSGQANFAGQWGYDASIGDIANSGAIRLRITTPVGSYAANAWGLYDMIGNVSEWCQDWYGEYPAGSVTDPQGPGEGPNRVLRGGDWETIARGCRSAARYFLAPLGTYSSYSNLGFRVVLAQVSP